ncbi:MAG TPA: efflux transporter outer membrane subunit [Casimicrobiaceae bacterium]|jgi:multidrug efflux system outer membrane protein
MRSLAMLIVVAVAGCTVGPNYVRPDIAVPDQWRIDYPKTAEVANTRWWEQFGDPELNDLIQTALRDNHDVRVAAARVDQFIGQLVATRSQLFPQIGYGAGASRFRSSREGLPALPPGVDNYFTLYEASLGASWQLDLFGRVRRLSEAARAQVYASEQAKRGVVLSLVAGVASSYILLRGLDSQLEIAQATARNFAETKRIFDARFKAGIVSRTEVSQITSQYQQALAAIPGIRQQIAAQENMICVLLGRNPGPIARGRTIHDLLTPLIPADLPSTLLERRPDILQAEQNLIAANANVGAAQALYFPSLSLTGALGTASTAFGAFLTGPASAWLIGASLAGPIFTAGGIEGQVGAAEAQQRQAVEFYKQTIINAFRETNDALTGSQETGEQVAEQVKRVQALREYARLSHLRFEKGVSSYLEVLIADNELFAAELVSVQMLANRYTQLVNVYQAMGGGWVDLADSVRAEPQGAAALRVP